MDLLKSGSPYGEVVQDGGGAVAEHHGRVELRDGSGNQPPMSVLLGGLGGQRDRVGAAANSLELLGLQQTLDVPAFEAEKVQLTRGLDLLHTYTMRRSGPGVPPLCPIWG
ncbi:hypothetical protein GCM10022236_30170 [Microlunatus ginsengisoli]|uniref:Uncharacterized protein n=2 Tax=Microlunatus ginsengisoli TaxID=363863 RepID=A0ABP7A6G2_9ACTN